MKVSALDHLVLTVESLTKTTTFYCDVLGMTKEEFRPADGTVRTALKFGKQKINLHQVGAEFLPNAEKPTSGSADLCFLSDYSIESWQAHLSKLGIPVEEGPIERTGATGRILSLYVRDPDQNLIEISNTI